MTREQIAQGLMVLALQLAHDADVPDGWMPHEWAYVKGCAAGEILRLRDRLVDVGRGTSRTSQTGMSQT